jgi:hypothetical protein
VVSFTPRPVYPRGKSPRYPLDRRLSGSQSRSGHCREEETPFPCGEPKPGYPARSGSPSLYASAIPAHFTSQGYSKCKQSTRVLDLSFGIPNFRQQEERTTPDLSNRCRRSQYKASTMLIDNKCIIRLSEQSCNSRQSLLSTAYRNCTRHKNSSLPTFLPSCY